MDKLHLISHILLLKLDNIELCKIILSFIFPYKQLFDKCLLQISKGVQLKKIYIYYDSFENKFVYLDRMIEDSVWLPLGWKCGWIVYEDNDEYYEILSKTKFNANFCSYKNKTLTDKYK